MPDGVDYDSGPAGQSASLKGGTAPPRMAPSGVSYSGGLGMLTMKVDRHVRGRKIPLRVQVPVVLSGANSFQQAAVDREIPSIVRVQIPAKSGCPWPGSWTGSGPPVTSSHLTVVLESSSRKAKLRRALFVYNGVVWLTVVVFVQAWHILSLEHGFLFCNLTRE